LIEDGKTLNCTLERFPNIMDAGIKNNKDTVTIKENLAHMVFSKTFEYRKETIQAIQRYIYDSFEIKGREVSLFVATPHEPDFSQRQKKLVYDVFYKKTREIFFLSGFLSAVSSSRELFQGFMDNKVIFIHLLETSSYSGLFFEGGEFHVSSFSKGFATITTTEIRDEINGVLERKSRELPGSFKGHPHISDEQIDRFQELWDDDSNYRLVIAAPEFIKKKIGNTISGFTIHYLDNYENCVLNGLSGIAENSEGIKRPSN
jgi:ribosomal protein S17E